MEKFIPYAKLSKKAKKEADRAKRNTWTMSPVTRRPVSPKAYNRKKAQRQFDRYGRTDSVLSYFQKIHINNN